MNNAPRIGGGPGGKEEIKPLYTALFVQDREALLAKYPPKHGKVLAHHSTIAFKPASLDGIEVGKEAALKILGRAYDEKGDALLVENAKSTNKYPHITLSCAEGVSPIYSNELIEKAIASGSFVYIEAPDEVSAVEGYFDGKAAVTEL